MEAINIKEIRNQSRERLMELQGELRAHIRNLRFTIQTRQRGNVRDLRKAKRDLARLSTILTEQNAKRS